MKKIIILCIGLCFQQLVLAFDQDLNASWVDVSNEELASCNCENASNGGLTKIRVQLPAKVFQYDMVRFDYYDHDSKKLLYSRQISGKKLRAEYESLGYFEEAILKDPDRPLLYSALANLCAEDADYLLEVEATGFFITGTQENTDSKGNKTTSPIYGERQVFGTTNTLPVLVSEELNEKVGNRKVLRGCGYIVVLALGAVWAVLTAEE